MVTRQLQSVTENFIKSTNEVLKAVELAVNEITRLSILAGKQSDYIEELSTEKSRLMSEIKHMNDFIYRQSVEQNVHLTEC